MTGIVRSPHCRAATVPAPSDAAQLKRQGSSHLGCVPVSLPGSSPKGRPLTSRAPGSHSDRRTCELAAPQIKRLPQSKYFLLDVNQTSRKVPIELVYLFFFVKDAANKLINEGDRMSTPIRILIQRKLSVDISASSG